MHGMMTLDDVRKGEGKLLMWLIGFSFFHHGVKIWGEKKKKKRKKKEKKV
jgi:hypothetical protein